MSKTVCFNPEIKIHYLIHWNFAYKTARIGPWQTFALDRFRFQCQIRNIENILRPIFDEMHRTRIWQQRFHEKNNVSSLLEYL